MNVRFFQAAVLLAAGLSSLPFLHWLVAQPAPLVAQKHELGFLADLLFGRDTSWAGYPAYFTWTLGLSAFTGLGAAALAATLAARVPDQVAVRRLAWSLVCAALSIAYFFFVTVNPQLRAAIGWRPDALVRLPLDFLAYGLGLLSPVLLARFFIGYPRRAANEEWEAFMRQHLASLRERVRSGSWHYRFYPPALRARMSTRTQKDRRWFHFDSDQAQASQLIRSVRFLESKTVLWLIASWALLAAGMDWLDATQASMPIRAGKALVAVMSFPFAVICVQVAMQSMQVHSMGAFADDRRKIDWIRSTILVGGIFALGSAVAPLIAGVLTTGYLAERGIFIPVRVLMYGPILGAAQLFSFALLVALAMSIFYRGAVDPRLAARKVTLVGVIGLVLAFLFILIERTVAKYVVAYFELSPDAGALIAGAGIAATVAPVRVRAERTVNAFAARYLPLDSLIEGERRELAVVISDLSGYTALSSRDEKQAMLVAALLQRQARKLTEAHGGRIVKSMGDAILFTFDDATTATKVLVELHRGFQPAAGQLGLEPLAVHSGAHCGEVTVAGDGDIYGQTVNLAARIQGSAGEGQVVVSRTFANAARSGAQFRELGSRQFKNVAEPVFCEELSLG